MSSASGPRKIQTPFDFQQFVRFGNHKPFPVDTAVEWRVHPSYEAVVEPKRQIYEVQVRLITMREGKPFGWIDYHFRATTIGKACQLIGDLRAHNIKWATWLNGVTPSLQDRAIRLTFNEGWAGTRVNGDGSTTSLDMGDVLTQFAGIAGAGSQDYAIVPAGKAAVDLKFGNELSEEELTQKMNAALAKMQSLFAGNVVFQALVKNGDQRFQVQEELVTKLPDNTDTHDIRGIVDKSGACQAIAIPTYASNDRCPYFEITETNIQGKNRYMDGGDSPWTGADLRYLLSMHEKAPKKDPGDEKDEYELGTGFDLSRAQSSGRPVHADFGYDFGAAAAALLAPPPARASSPSTTAEAGDPVEDLTASLVGLDHVEEASDEEDDVPPLLEDVDDGKGKVDK